MRVRKVSVFLILKWLHNKHRLAHQFDQVKLQKVQVQEIKVHLCDM